MAECSRRAFITAGMLAGGAIAIGLAIRRGARADTAAVSAPGANETGLNLWIRIAADNSITVLLPHAEMGQGIHTTLAMMLADELDADWHTVRILEAPANEEFANFALRKGYSVGQIPFPAFDIGLSEGVFFDRPSAVGNQVTGDSTSVRFTGQLIMRVAGASAKAVLLQSAADTWKVDTGSLRAEKSHIIHDATNRRAPFIDFATGIANLSRSPVPALKRIDEFSIMGTNVSRVDVPPKVDGSARYGIDVALPGMKYAAIRAAPVFGALVAGIDDREIRDLPGIRRIVNLGNAVAIVADSYWQAQRAAERIGVQWSETGRETLAQKGIFRQLSAALDEATARGGFEPDLELGDTGRAFAAADRIIEAEYRVPYLAHAPMEPLNCTAWIHDDQCELWLGTQNPLGFRSSVARAIGFEADRVSIHNHYLGGGFGRRSVSDYAEQAARIAADVSYPVKLIWSREEDIRQDRYRQASIARLSAALDAKGWPTAWRNRYVEKHFPLKSAHIPYRIGNQLIQFIESKTHVPWGFWRSVDGSVHTFFTESFIDELAATAGRDPFEYRRELLAGEPRYLAALEQVAEEAGWGRALPENYGRGIAIYGGFGSIVAQVVEVEIQRGRLRVDRVFCAIDAGFAVNPDGMKAQMEGGIVFGLTAALYGEISLRNGAVEQSNFHDYQLLRMDETPDIETIIINGGGGLGGVGEAGVPPVAPALTNAIYDATGKRIRELPIKNIAFALQGPAGETL